MMKPGYQTLRGIQIILANKGKKISTGASVRRDERLGKVYLRQMRGWEKLTHDGPPCP